MQRVNRVSADSRAVHHASSSRSSRWTVRCCCRWSSAAAAAVGYELSPRKHKDWQGMLGHTCTLLDMGVMDDLGAGWSLRRLSRKFGVVNYEPDPMRPNWPDTELLLNYLLRENGITPHLIGHEDNHVRNKDENIDHCRSLTSGLLYNETYYRIARSWAEEAMTEGGSGLKSGHRHRGSG